MTFSFTGLVYLIASLAFTLYLGRFYRLWKESRTTMSKIFLFLGISFYFFTLVTLIGVVFFTDNSQVLKWVVVFATFLQSFVMAFLAYLVIHIGMPKISPWIGFSIIFILGIIATVTTALSSFGPFLESTGVMNWDYPAANRIIRAIIGLSVMIPLVIIFFQQGLASKISKVRKRAIIFGFVFLVGLAAIVVAFLIGGDSGVGAIGEDVFILILCFAILALILLSPKHPKPTYVEKVYEE